MSAGPMTTEELFREHASFVARFLVRLGVPYAQVEDALQEVFLVVHRNGGYRPGLAKPTSYLAGIALHAASKHRRRERVERVRHAELPEQLASHDADPTRELQAQQDLERLQLALDRLPDELRTTLVLIEIEGESSVSVAAALGWPVGTVYWRLHEARKRLQAALKSVDAERTQQRRVAVRSAPPERRRARASSLGMIMLFGKPAFDRSEAARLLRLAREQTIPAGTVEQLLIQHAQLVQAGAPMPSWGAGVTPHTATWFGLLGVGGTAGVAIVGGALIAAAMMWMRPVEHTHARALTRREPAQIAVAVQATVKPAVPVAAAPDIAKTPTAVPADRIAPARAVAPARAEPVATGDIETTKLAPASPAARTQRPAALRSQLEQAAAAPAPARATAPEATEPAKLLQPQQPQVQQPQVQQPQPRRAAGGDELAEMKDIATAERLIGSDPARALAIVQSVRARFPDGYFREEHAYVEVMALLELGRTDEGRAKADAFLRKYPDGPYSRRVQTAAARGAH